MAMELLAEESLEDRLIADGRCRPEEALALFESLCDALGSAHARGIIHRDIKARNIGFVRDSNQLRDVKLLDFGIAKLLEPSGPGQSSPTQRVGTPQSMSPEQIRGERVDARTDVYGLGVLLFHVLTGRYPFEADDSLEVERMHLEAVPPRASELVPLSPAIDRLVARAMAKDPIDRPASVAEMLEELRAAVGTTTVERVVPAVAVYIGIHHGDPTDADLDRIAAQQRDIAERLTTAGFVIALATATSTLAVQILPAVATLAAAAVREAMVIVAAIERSLHERDDAVPGAAIVAAVHAATASVRDRGAGRSLEVSGGEILEETSWIPAPGGPTAVYVSPAARARAEDE
jgi:serine/threonine-protein kinase